MVKEPCRQLIVHFAYSGEKERCLVLWLLSMVEYYRILTRKNFFHSPVSGESMAFPLSPSACVYEVHQMVCQIVCLPRVIYAVLTTYSSVLGNAITESEAKEI